MREGSSVLVRASVRCLNFQDNEARDFLLIVLRIHAHQVSKTPRTWKKNPAHRIRVSIRKPEDPFFPIVHSTKLTNIIHRPGRQQSQLETLKLVGRAFVPICASKRAEPFQSAPKSKRRVERDQVDAIKLLNINNLRLEFESLPSLRLRTIFLLQSFAPRENIDLC